MSLITFPTSILITSNLGIDSESLHSINDLKEVQEANLSLKNLIVLDSSYKKIIKFRYSAHFILDDHAYMKRILNTVITFYKMSTDSEGSYFSSEFSNIKVLT